MIIEKRRERNKRNSILGNMLLFISIGVGCVYFTLLFRIVLFKYISIGSIFTENLDSELRSVNFMPFKDFGYMLSSDGILGVAKNYGGNIGLFFPLGILLPLFFRKINGMRVIATGFILSLFFEITQYILCLGASDVDDLLMNTLGAASGYLVYYILNRKTDDTVKIRFKSLLVLAIVGALGLAAVYEIHPSSIAQSECVQVNKEILGDLSEISDVDGVITKMEDGELVIETYAYTDTNNNEIPSKQYNYKVTDNTKFYCQEIEGTYNAGGNVTKVTSIYSEIDYKKLKEGFDPDKGQSADIWLDGDNIKAVKIIKHTKAE